MIVLGAIPVDIAHAAFVTGCEAARASSRGADTGWVAASRYARLHAPAAMREAVRYTFLHAYRQSRDTPVKRAG